MKSSSDHFDCTSSDSDVLLSEWEKGCGTHEFVDNANSEPACDAGQWNKLREIHLANSYYSRYGKRLFDLAVGSICIVLLFPIMLCIAFLVRVVIGPNIFFRQSRVGLNGSTFNILKFRTMRPDMRKNAKPVSNDRRKNGHKCDLDPRHTRLGKHLRRFGLDELPQLINVVRGDMSLVGPRPEIIVVARSRGYFFHPRHIVRPGITGPFQVSNLRQKGDLSAGLSIDEHYVANLAFGRDLSLILSTPKKLIRSSSRSYASPE